MAAKHRLTKAEREHKRWMNKRYGMILADTVHMTSVAETTVEACISDVICKDSKEGLILTEYVLQYMTFGSKTRALKRLLKDKHPTLFKKYLKEIETLEKIYEFRNTISHSMLADEDRFVKKMYEDRIPFHNYARSNQTIYILIDEHIERIKTLTKINNLLANGISMKLNPRRSS